MNHFWHLHLFEKCLTCSLRFLCPCPPCRLQQPLQVPTGLSEEDRSVTHLQSDVRGVWVQRTGAALWRSSSAAKTSRLYAAADGQDREVQGGPVGQGGWAGCWFLCSFQSEHLQCSDNCVVRLEVVSQDDGYGLIAGPSQFLIDVAVLIFEYVTLLWNVDHGYAAFLLYFWCHYFYYPVCKPPPSSALALTALVTRYFCPENLDFVCVFMLWKYFVYLAPFRMTFY